MVMSNYPPAIIRRSQGLRSPIFAIDKAVPLLTQASAPGCECTQTGYVEYISVNVIFWGICF